MRTIAILTLTLILLGCQKPQKLSDTMTNTKAIQETVARLFVNTDQKHWDGVEQQFASKVHLDYSSMTGLPAEDLSPSEITANWKAVLPGFTHTHHQIGNFIIDASETKAHVFCYGTATHYLDDENGNLWTVVGSYDFDLENIAGSWRVTRMKFNYKYQTGNSGLVALAIKNAKTE